MLVEFDLLRIGVAEGFCGTSSFLEPGFFGTTFFVVDERFVEILESLLEWVDGHFGEPLGLWCVSPLSEFTAESGVTEKFESFFLSFVLQGEGFIEDESFGASEAFHAAGLLAVGPCPIFEGLELFHGAIILWSMETNKEIRHGRHCVFKLHVHLVFVTKYRRGVLDGDAVLRLRVMFAKVCDDFEAELVELNGEDDHVHLLVSLSAEGFALAAGEQPQGCVESSFAKGAPGPAGSLLEKRSVVAVVLCIVLWWCPAFNYSAVCEEPANAAMNLVSNAILPRPERRGLSRFSVKK